MGATMLGRVLGLNSLNAVQKVQEAPSDMFIREFSAHPTNYVSKDYQSRKFPVYSGCVGILVQFLHSKLAITGSCSYRPGDIGQDGKEAIVQIPKPHPSTREDDSPHGQTISSTNLLSFSYCVKQTERPNGNDEPRHETRPNKTHDKRGGNMAAW